MNSIHAILKLSYLKKSLIVLVLFCCSISGFSQNDVDFLLNKITSVYLPLGMPFDSVDYSNHLKKVKERNKRDTFRLLSEAFLYFDDRHLSFFQPRAARLVDSISSKGIESVKQKLSKIKKQGSYGLQGYWVNDLNNCVIMLVKKPKRKNEYEGYAIECAKKHIVGKKVLSVYTYKDNSAFAEFLNFDIDYKASSTVKFSNRKDTIQLSSYSKWSLIHNYKENFLVKSVLYNSAPSVKLLDSTTVLFTIPSNSGENSKIVDSLMNAWKSVLSKAKLLVIDIRNNPGGTPRVYSSLIPFIYTNPIFRGEGYTYISSEFIEYEKNMLLKIDSLNDSLAYKSQSKHIVNLSSQKLTHQYLAGKTKYLDSIYEYPKHVALIVNYGCMSAAEVMILDFKQSRKVTIFGENTAGATDNLEFFPVRSPSKKYAVLMPGFRVKPNPVYKHYQGVGIAPDIYLTNLHPKDWINFVKHYYEKL